MKASKKIQRKLDARLKDYVVTETSNFAGQPKVEQRFDTGGFTRPGSRKK